MKTTLLKKIRERFEIISRLDNTDPALRAWDRYYMTMRYYYGINDFVKCTYSKIYLTNPLLQFFDRQISATDKKRAKGEQLNSYYTAKRAGKVYDRMKSLTLDKAAFIGDNKVPDDFG